MNNQMISLVFVLNLLANMFLGFILPVLPGTEPVLEEIFCPGAPTLERTITNRNSYFRCRDGDKLNDVTGTYYLILAALMVEPLVVLAVLLATRRKPAAAADAKRKNDDALLDFTGEKRKNDAPPLPDGWTGTQVQTFTVTMDGKNVVSSSQTLPLGGAADVGALLGGDLFGGGFARMVEDMRRLKQDYAAGGLSSEEYQRRVLELAQGAFGADVHVAADGHTDVQGTPLTALMQQAQRSAVGLSLADRLRQLQDAYDAGLLTRAEFDQQRQFILDDHSLK